jgi:hypothetical protein
MEKLTTYMPAIRAPEARNKPLGSRLRVAWCLSLNLPGLILLLASNSLGYEEPAAGRVEPASSLHLPMGLASSEPVSSHSEGQPELILTSQQIAIKAAENFSPAKLVLQNHFSEDATGLCHNEATRATLWDVRCAAALRLREEAARNALQLHYALAATYRAEDLLQRTFAELQLQRITQSKLIAQGISIADSTLVDRLARDWEDRWLENQSKRSQLRIQLSGLIGSAQACSYHPRIELELSPSDRDVCEYLHSAMDCRQEIALLKRLRKAVDEDHLAVWDSLAGYLIGGPVAVANSTSVIAKLRRTILRGEVEQAIRNRSRWLETLIQERTKQITIEVEVAFEKKRSAALRWANSKQLIQTWDSRVKELVQLGEEYQGNLASQAEARLQRLSSERSELERWLDWHQAQIDLLHASGTILSSPLTD